MFCEDMENEYKKAYIAWVLEETDEKYNTVIAVFQKYGTVEDFLLNYKNWEREIEIEYFSE